jgi:hypothetical protein
MKASDVKQRMQNQPKTSSDLRNKFRSQKTDLVQRHQEQIDNKDQGNEFSTIFDKTKIPKGIGFWKPGKGEHEIDIIPFFAGCQHNRVPEGKVAYVVDLFVHTNVGPLRTPYPCLAKNFKETDPICEYISKNRLSKEEWKKISSKRRTVYLVWVHDTPEEEKKGLQIWELAHYFFEQHIDEIAKTPRGGGAIPFSDVEVGKTIAFSIKNTGKYEDANGVERESIAYSGHRLIDRQDPQIPDHILDQIFSLDEVILMRPDYDEMDEAFNGPSKTKKDVSPDQEYDEGQGEEQKEHPYDFDDDIPSEGQKTPKGSGKKPKPESEPPIEKEEEITEEEIPIACPTCNGKGKSKKGQTCSECNGTGEYIEEEVPEKEEGEVTEEEGEGEVTECPHDPDSFGEVDEHPECENDGGCPLWDLCSDEAGRRKKEEETKKVMGGKKPMASNVNKPKRKLGK